MTPQTFSTATPLLRQAAPSRELRPILGAPVDQVEGRPPGGWRLLGWALTPLLVLVLTGSVFGGVVGYAISRLVKLVLASLSLGG